MRELIGRTDETELGETRDQIDQVTMTIERIIGNVLTVGREIRWKEISALSSQMEAPTDHVPVRAASKIGRNAPCPCGSGRKWKQCCGAPDAVALKLS